MSKKAKEKKHQVGEVKNGYERRYFKTLAPEPDAVWSQATAKIILMSANSGFNWVATQNAMLLGLKHIAVGNPESGWFLDHMVDAVLDECWNKAYATAYGYMNDERKAGKEADRIAKDFLDNLECL